MRVSDELPSVVEVSYIPPGDEADFHEGKLARWIMRLYRQQEEKEEEASCVHF